MVKTPFAGALHYLMHRLGRTPAEPSADAVLLQRYAAGRDETAFTALVQRHGPLVQRVCRQLALQPHDADDAFQATFLVLARKAGSVRRGASLAGWLYRVAYHVALQTRIRAARRQKHERQAARVTSFTIPDPVERQELAPVVHEEVNRLPEKYRLPVLLCYLGDHTNEEAARELALPVGTLKTRLLHARELLRGRLLRRGVTLSVGAVAALLAGEASAGSLPAAVLASTVEAARLFLAGQVQPAPAIFLAQGALKTMWLAKCKFLTVLVVCLAAVGLATGALVYRPHVDTPATPPAGATGGPQAPPPRAEDGPGRTDLHGDPLPPGALARLGTTRWRLPGEVEFLAFLADGKRVLSVSRDGLCQVWEAPGGRQLRSFDVSEEVCSGVALAPDGGTLATATNAGKVILWDVDAGKKRRSLQAAPSSWPPQVVFAADGRSLYTSDPSQRGQITRWDAVTGNELGRFDAPPYAGPALLGPGCPELIRSADGKTLASFGHEQPQVRKVVVALWDLPSGKRRSVIAGPGGTGWVSALALSPDGKRLAWAGDGGQLRLHDAAADKQLLELDAKVPARRHVLDCTFSPDGKLLATQLTDGAVLLWDSATGDLRPERGEAASGPFSPGRYRGSRLAFSADGQTLAAPSSGHLVRLLDPATGKPLPVPVAPTAGLRTPLLSRDGREVTAQDSSGHLFRWAVATGKPLPLTTGEEKVSGPWFQSRDGGVVAVLRDENTFALRTAKDAREISTLALPKLDQRHKLDMERIDTWAGLLFAPDGRTVVTRGGDRRTLCAWQDGDGKKLRDVRVERSDLVEATGSGRWIPGFGIGDVCLAPDGMTLVVYFWGHYGKGRDFGRWDRKDEIILFSLATGKEVRSWQLPPGPVRRVAVSPSGRVLVVSSPAAGLALWELATGQERAALAGRGEDCLAFAPDGRVLAAAGADGVVHLWDLATARALGKFTGHRGAVGGLAFTPDGRKLISAGADTTALVWDAASLLPKDTPKPADRPAGLQCSLTARRLDELWKDLAGSPATAYRAMQELHTAPAQAVQLLRERVTAVEAVEAGQIERWITELDSPEFTVRERATAELDKHGDEALPAMQKSLAGQPAAEVRRRLTRLVDGVTAGQMPAETLRCLRATEVLEGLDAAATRQVLEKLSRGAPEARLTREARTSLGLLGQ
jgi:RNA polymerase sigma factor (sigma-70 family)